MKKRMFLSCKVDRGCFLRFKTVINQLVDNTEVYKNEFIHILHYMCFQIKFQKLISFSLDCSWRTEAVWNQLEDLKPISGGIAK